MRGRHKHRRDLKAFVEEHGVKVLNMAGPRASKEPGVGEFVMRTLEEAFGNMARGTETGRGSHSWGYTRDPAIRPSKHGRLRAELWLFSRSWHFFLIKSPFEPPLQPGMRAGSRRFCAFWEIEKIARRP